MCEITKIPLVIFPFNLTAIFNGNEVFKIKRKFDTPNLEFLNVRGVSTKIVKVQKGLVKFSPKRKKKKKNCLGTTL